MTQVQARRPLAPRPAYLQRRSRARSVGSKPKEPGYQPWVAALHARRTGEDPVGEGTPPAPPPGDAYPSGRGLRAARPPVGERSAGPAPAYKSGAAVQLAHFSLRPVTRTPRETHRPDAPW